MVQTSFWQSSELSSEAQRSSHLESLPCFIALLSQTRLLFVTQVGYPSSGNPG
jgi:hypothetical protein